MKKYSLVATTLFLMLSCFGLGGCDALDAPKIEPVYNDAGQIQVQIDSERCEDNNYETVLKKLKQAGFKNFKINFEGDIIIGLLATENDIDSIRINGVSNFDKDSYFDTKSVVFMDVHSKKADLKLITEAIDGQLPILYSTNSFKGNDKLYAGEQLTNVGFTHVAYNPIQDCYSSSDWDYNDAEEFTVNGNSSFYDYSFFDIDANIRISYHTVTGDYCTNGLEHTFKDSPAVEPTCTEPGWTAGTYCIVCNTAFSGHVEIPAKGHKVVIDKPGYTATCVSTGLSDESHCSECNQILSIQEVLPIDSDNHVHTETITGEEATCVSTGISDKIICHDCEKVIQEHEELPIDPDNHKHIVTTDEVRPNNGHDGHTASSHCEDCNKIIQQSTTIPWSGSSEERTATNELESVFSKDTAKKAVLTAMCNYFSTDVLDSSGNYVVASKLHNYAYASTKYRITSAGTWKWAGEKKWRFEGFTLYGSEWKQSYPLYGYISVDSTKYHLTGVNNGKSNNPSQYITYYDETCFNFSISLV